MWLTLLAPCVSSLLCVVRIFDRVHAQVADSGFIKSTLFNKAYTSKLAKLHAGDIGPNGKIDSAWDKIIFGKIAALFGGKVKLMSSGAAPLSTKVGDFMRVTFMAHFVEGYGLTGAYGQEAANKRQHTRERSGPCAGSVLFSLAFCVSPPPSLPPPSPLSCRLSSPETGAALTCSSRDDTVYGHVGTPLDCNMVKLVDVPDMDYTSNDRPNPRGEVWVSGYNVFHGYYKQPDVTAEVFQTDNEGRRWFMTGDIAAWLPDGSLKIVDRKKGQHRQTERHSEEGQIDRWRVDAEISERVSLLS